MVGEELIQLEEKTFLDFVEKGNLAKVQQYLTNNGNINSRRNHRVNSTVNFLLCHNIIKPTMTIVT